MKVILASKSPRRKELMDLLNINYEIIASNEKETLEKNLTFEEQSKKLAYIKAKSVFNKTSGDRIVIGSDTLVMKDGKLYGKPKDKQDAINMLKNLKNSKHEVLTSLSIIAQKENIYEEYTNCNITDVYLTDMTDEEIEKWVDTGEAYDKAGAYAIQSNFTKFIKKINGNYDAVIGLPVNEVYKVLKKYIQI